MSNEEIIALAKQAMNDLRQYNEPMLGHEQSAYNALRLLITENEKHKAVVKILSKEIEDLNFYKARYKELSDEVYRNRSNRDLPG